MNNVLYLIYNPKSGSANAESLEHLAQRICRAQNWKLKTYPIKSAEQFQSTIQQAIADAKKEPGTVAAAGGDGTLRAVAEAVLGTSLRFAIIPCGTFNIFARSHGIPLDSEKALQLALTGKPTAVRIGKINDHVFLINANLGLYAKAIQERKQQTKRWGRRRLVAMLSTAATMLKRHSPLQVHLQHDQRSADMKTSMIFIGNSSMQIENMNLDFGKKETLAVFLLKPLSRWGILRILFKGLARNLEREKSLIQFDVKNLTIDTRRKLHKVALDGEMLEMTSPFYVESLPSGLDLVKPPQSIS